MWDKVILVMYSGGLDSLGMLYRILTDPEYKDFGVHVHHVHIKNIENRANAEAMTVKLALSQLMNMGLKFQYSESEIGAPFFGNQFMYDMYAYNFMAGYVCSLNKNITKIAIGLNVDDEDDDPVSLKERRKRANALLAAYTDVEKIYPMAEMTKKNIYESLPSGLRELFWSCRTPKYFSDRVEPCGTCRPCVQLTSQGIRAPLG